MEPYILKAYPALLNVIRAALPGYRKNKAYVSAFPDCGKDINTFWDGGSRDCYILVYLPTLEIKSLPTRTHPWFDIASRGLAGAENQDLSVDERGGVTLKRLPVDYVLIQAGTFCGKPSTAHVFVNPANLVKLLPA
jgi:hypothetical protein